MEGLLLIPTISLTAYLSYIVAKFGVLPSISDSYRYIKHKWLFTLVLWATAIPLMIVGEHGLMFFAGAGICFVGAAPAFWEKMEGTVHVVGAIGGIALGVLGMALFGFGGLALPYALFVVLTHLKIKKKRILPIKNKTWGVEIGAFVAILIALYLHTTNIV